MSSLIATIEQFDPGHFDRRRKYLLELLEELKEIGFFPLQITQNDIECYRVRIESNSKDLPVTCEMIEDIKHTPSLMDALKEAARYEKR